MPNLETVTLPANLTGIPKDAFANSAKLATVKFGAADANTPSARAVTGVDNAITLPTGLTSLGNNAFAGTKATTVDLSKVTGLTTIGENVFRGMTSLATVTLPSGLTTIGNNAFQNDAALKTLSQESPKAAREQETTPATTATFGKSLTNIGQNAFQGTGFTTVDLSKAVGTATSAGGSSPTTPAQTLTVGSGAFTNMASLTEVKLPANADINPTYFGNPADAAGTAPKLASITYVGTDATATATATATLSDQTISSPNFSKIKNSSIEIKSSVGGSTINFTGGVFNGNDTMTTLKLSVTATNGNNPL